MMWQVIAVIATTAALSWMAVAILLAVKYRADVRPRQ